ncbi:phosphohydrolase [Capnocytophaga bilenii]
MLEKAILIATIAHKGQIDKGGAPYIMHLIRVMNAGNTENEKICGILHDLIEDTEWTFEKLKEEGFDDEIIEALQCVTKLPNENYEEFIARIITNPLAIKIKLNDLKDNMDITRLSFISEEDCERLNKYLKAYQLLLSKA